MNDGRITVLGEPVAKERPRVGKQGRLYTPRATKNFETMVAWLAKAQLPKYRDNERLVIELQFYCSADHKDLDNLCKSILDGLQKAGTFRNDKQIVELHATKKVVVGKEAARTEITIRSFG